MIQVSGVSATVLGLIWYVNVSCSQCISISGHIHRARWRVWQPANGSVTKGPEFRHSYNHDLNKRATLPAHQLSRVPWYPHSDIICLQSHEI